MTANQVLIGVGLILVLAVGSQVLASRLKIPALIILLPAGFTAGAITTDVNPQRLLGAAFQPLVSLAVAVILYDAGMSLDLRKLRGHTRRVVDRLIVMGVPVTFAFGGGVRRPAARHVQAGGADDRRDPGGVGADGGGAAAHLHPAHRTAAAGAVLGRVADQPRRRHSRGRRLPRRGGEHPPGTRLPARAVPGRHRRGPGGRAGRRRAAVAAAAQAPARRDPRHVGPACLGRRRRRLLRRYPRRRGTHLGHCHGAGRGQPPRLRRARPAAVLRDPGTADYRRAVHLHLGHGDARLAAAPDPAHAGAYRDPGADHKAAGGLPGHAPYRHDRRGTGVHRLDGAPRHRRGRHRLDLLRRTRRPAHRRRVEDPAGHVPRHRGHRGAVRPDRRAGRPAGPRHAAGPAPGRCWWAARTGSWTSGARCGRWAWRS